MNNNNTFEKIREILGLKNEVVKQQFKEMSLMNGMTLTNNAEKDFEVGDKVYYVTEDDGVMKPVEMGEYETRDGMIVTVGEQGDIMEISGVDVVEDDEVVESVEDEEEVVVEEDMVDFPFDECMLKMEGEGYSKDVAEKICGKIKAENSQAATFKKQLKIENDVNNIKSSLEMILSLQEEIKNSLSQELGSLKNEYDAFKKQTAYEPLEKKITIKQDADPRVEFYKKFLKK